tara:strand:+ start:243 stop:482 length:240 start_codon:yes stop_codon:yes gene_type:complete
MNLSIMPFLLQIIYYKLISLLQIKIYYKLKTTKKIRLQKLLQIKNYKKEGGAEAPPTFMFTRRSRNSKGPFHHQRLCSR